jgi:hypothetical protein
MGGTSTGVHVFSLAFWIRLGYEALMAGCGQLHVPAAVTTVEGLARAVKIEQAECDLRG